MQLINIKIKGSSIMEVVTALVIISLSIAFTGVLFARVFGNSNRLLQQKAWFVVNEMGNKALLNKEIEEGEVTYESFFVKKKSFVIDEAKGLWLLEFEAHQLDGKQLTKRRILLELTETSVVR